LPWVCKVCAEAFDTRELAFEHLLRRHKGQRWKGMIKQVVQAKGEIPLDRFH